MAKKNLRSKRIEKNGIASKSIQKGLMNCRVNLIRLSQEEIEKYLKPARVLRSKITATATTKTATATTKTAKAKKAVSVQKFPIEPPNNSVSGRVLRPRRSPVKSTTVRSKKDRSDSAAAKSHSNQMVGKAWRLCTSKANVIRTGSIVMAKLKGHPAWPAVVLEYTSKSTVKVKFFGVQEHEMFGFVNVLRGVTLFEQSSDLIILLLRRNIPDFKKGVLEAEFFCDVPSHDSLVNEI